MSFRVIFFALIVTSLTTAALAQDATCNKKLADLPDAPEFHGFHLGMTQDQVKARVPQVVFGKTDAIGVSKVSINPFFDPKIDQSAFADVRTVSLDFLDGKLTSLWVGYDSTFKWKTLNDFVNGISSELGLLNSWRAKGRNQVLRCADFELTASMIGGGPGLRVLDSAADETIAQRRQAKEDEATAAEATSPETHVVVGDNRSKIYYGTDCEALKTVPEKSRIAFENEAAAEKAGYKRAEGCQ